jgi:hypothetical protein
MPAARKKMASKPNALPGFYQDGFQDDEITDLEAMLDGGLSAEIAMLRASTRRLFHLSAGEETIERSIKTLRELGLSATRLATLLKVQTELDDKKGDEFTLATHEALKEIVQELRLGE